MSDRSTIGSGLAIEPEGIREWLRGAVEAGGATVVPVAEADALLWAAPDDPEGLRTVLDEHGDHLRWVQLPWAGIEPYVGVLDHGRTWTCGKGVYAEPVAEMALALSLAGLRGLDRYARSATWREHGTIGTNLHDARVVVLGGGGITESFLRMIGPFGCRTTVVRRRPDGPPPAPGVQVVGDDRLAEAVTGADLVVLALALTPGTTGIVDAALLERMGTRCHLVNVARGGHVVTDDLVVALRDGAIASAGLDVTDPEPLPDDHPLWSLPNCLITPHVGNTPEMAVPLLSARITDNVGRWRRGEPLVGLVDVDLGY